MNSDIGEDRDPITLCWVAKQCALDALSPSRAEPPRHEHRGCGAGGGQRGDQAEAATVTKEAAALYLHRGTRGGADGWPGPGPHRSLPHQAPAQTAGRRPAPSPARTMAGPGRDRPLRR